MSMFYVRHIICKFENSCHCHTLLRNYAVGRIPGKFGGKSDGHKTWTIGVDGYFMLIIPVATFCLGSWQVQRRQWKLDLIKSLQEKTTADPVEFPYNVDDLENMEYRKVRVKGRFDHSKELYVQPRSLLSNGEESGGGLMSSGNSGAHVITPFHLEEQELTILVNRGWVSRKKMHPDTRRDGQTEGLVELVGVVRNAEKRAPFVPKNTAGSRNFHYRDTEAMAEMCDAAPIFLDADYKSTIPDGPIGGQTRVSLRNEHLSYIFTCVGKKPVPRPVSNPPQFTSVGFRICDLAN